jgi:hypothetical protein
MRRALQTAQLCLDTKAMKENGATLFVRGDAREILDSQCDFPFDIYNSLNNFKEFDFSHIEESLKKHKEMFIADFLTNEESSKELKELAVKTKDLDQDGRIKELLNLLKQKKLNDLAIETNQNVFERIQLLKQFLRTYIKENNVKDRELIVVAHSRLCKAVQASGVNPEDDEFIDFRVIDNCELFEVEI